jgi:LPS O-antigen subunit length determinant protein (WzzB/FepE family)
MLTPASQPNEVKEMREKRDEVRRQLISLWSLNSREEEAEKADRLQLRCWFAHQSPTSPIKRVRPRRALIQIKGKPLSETVGEYRR